MKEGEVEEEEVEEEEVEVEVGAESLTLRKQSASFRATDGLR